MARPGSPNPLCRSIVAMATLPPTPADFRWADFDGVVADARSRPLPTTRRERVMASNHLPSHRARATPIPRRAMASRRDRVLTRRPRPHRDAVQRGQRLPRYARQPRGGSRCAYTRHLPQRVPRDVGHPARRERVRLREGRPDHRQRARCEADQAVRRRRTAAARNRGLRRVRTVDRLPGGRARPKPAVAHPGRQAGERPIDAHGVDGRAPSRRDDLRGDAARFERSGRDLLAVAQPPGRRGRVPRSRRSARRSPHREGPAQGQQLRPARSRADIAARSHGARPRRGGPGIHVRQQRDDPGVRVPARDLHRLTLHRIDRGRSRPGQDRDRGPRGTERADRVDEVRELPHVDGRALRRARRPLLANSAPSLRSRRRRAAHRADHGAGSILGVGRRRDRR